MIRPCLGMVMNSKGCQRTTEDHRSEYLDMPGTRPRLCCHASFGPGDVSFIAAAHRTFHSHVVHDDSSFTLRGVEGRVFRARPHSRAKRGDMDERAENKVKTEREVLVPRSLVVVVSERCKTSIHQIPESGQSPCSSHLDELCSFSRRPLLSESFSRLIGSGTTGIVATSSTKTCTVLLYSPPRSLLPQSLRVPHPGSLQSP